MTDNQYQGPFVPPSAPAYPQPGADGQVPAHPPQPGGELYPGSHMRPEQYPQPGQWNQSWPAPRVEYQAQPGQRRTGMFVGGIILTVFGGLALLGRLGMATSGAVTTHSPGLGYAVGYMIGFLGFVVAPLVGGLIMIVRSKRP